MATVTSLVGTDGITTANSMTKINTNFSNLNTDKIETSVIDTDTALGANSDTKIPSQKAVKAYADSIVGIAASETVKGNVEEATDAEVTAGTASGTLAKLFITPTKLLTYLTSIFVGAPIRSIVFSTLFETSARFTSIVNSGTNTFNTTGMAMDTTATGNRAAGVTLDLGGSSGNLFTGSPVFSASFVVTTTSFNFDAYFGIGIVTKSGTGHTFTTDHAGFKVLTTGSTPASLYGTQGDGTTESATSALTTFVVGDAVEVMLKINGTASIDYYWRKNGGSWSSATNKTTNMPDTADYRLQFSLSNINTAQSTVLSVAQASYTR